MINGLILGRLGNQMFQYATLRAMQEKYYNNEMINMNFKIVRKLGLKEDGFDNQLEMFKLKKDKICFDQEVKMSIRQRMFYYAYLFFLKLIRVFSENKKNEINRNKFERKIQEKYNNLGLFLYSYGFYDFKKSKEKEKIFKGYFESAKFFNDIRNELLEEFEPINDKLPKNKELYDSIENNNSVCISIRRGDFLIKKHKDDCFVCDNTYFENAMKEIKARVKNPQFIVFSDDIEWCKKNMFFDKGTLFEDGDDPVWEKLRLMYSCKHFIISNSTFSWWSQYLSRNENKIVVAPSRWRNKSYIIDIYEKDWILI